MVVHIDFRKQMVVKIVAMIGAIIAITSMFVIPIGMNTGNLATALIIEWATLSTLATVGIAYAWYMWYRVPLSVTGGLSTREFESYLAYTKGYFDGKTIGIMIAETEIELLRDRFHKTPDEAVSAIKVRVFPLETEIGCVLDIVA